MAKISDAGALKIVDALGNWTLKVRVLLEDGSEGSVSVPSGVSVGRYESRSVSAEQAIANFYHIIKEKILGFEAQDQERLDRLLISLDGSPNKVNLGANTLLAVSAAVCTAAASSLKKPLYRYIDSLFEPATVNFNLPVPLFNVIEGGKHTHNDLDFQEFLFIPNAAQPFLKRIEIGVQFYQELKKALLDKGLTVAVGDEGGFSPNGIDNLGALKIMQGVFTTLALSPSEAGLGLDAAAGQFFVEGSYHLKNPPRALNSHDLISFYVSLLKEFPLVYLEDPLSEDDSAWEELRDNMTGRIRIIGDDLTVTNAQRLQDIAPRKIIQGIIIKPNQVGTITETLETAALAKKAGLSLVVSHRAGETESSFIADFAVGIGADYIKFGAPARGERVVKYDRLLEIEEEVSLSD